MVRQLRAAADAADSSRDLAGADEPVLGERVEVLAGAAHGDVEVGGDVVGRGVADPRARRTARRAARSGSGGGDDDAAVGGSGAPVVIASTPA